MTRRSAMLLFPGFTALDAIGPYHALAAAHPSARKKPSAPE